MKLVLLSLTVVFPQPNWLQSLQLFPATLSRCSVCSVPFNFTWKKINSFAPKTLWYFAWNYSHWDLQRTRRWCSLEVLHYPIRLLITLCSNNACIGAKYTKWENLFPVLFINKFWAAPIAVRSVSVNHTKDEKKKEISLQDRRVLTGYMCTEEKPLDFKHCIVINSICQKWSIN